MFLQGGKWKTRGVEIHFTLEARGHVLPSDPLSPTSSGRSQVPRRRYHVTNVRSIRSVAINVVGILILTRLCNLLRPLGLSSSTL